ncbi:MAG TPA: FMN-binding protein [Acidimicrobiales bacterium]|nr:FMN-binding protein [Acidimicrobiales bacterium]
MRRAVIATAGTVAGLVLLLGYKSGTPDKAQKVHLGGSTSSTAGTAAAPTPTGSSAKTYPGQLVTYLYGDIQVSVTIEGRRLVNVDVPRNDAVDPHSQLINSEAVPVLEQEALSAQGLNFNVVSGATYTSDAFAQSLQTALQKEGRA